MDKLALLTYCTLLRYVIDVIEIQCRVLSDNPSGFIHTCFQALRAVSHNYPDIIILCWVQISSTTYGFLRFTSPEDPTRSWKGNIGNVTGSTGEKVITAAIKVGCPMLHAFTIS